MNERHSVAGVYSYSPRQCTGSFTSVPQFSHILGRIFGAVLPAVSCGT